MKIRENDIDNRHGDDLNRQFIGNKERIHGWNIPTEGELERNTVERHRLTSGADVFSGEMILFPEGGTSTNLPGCLSNP